MLTMTFVGMDSHDRPVYEDDSGKLWKDVDPRSWMEPRICSALNNDFDGEPDIPYYGEVMFLPVRVTWLTRCICDDYE